MKVRLAGNLETSSPLLSVRAPELREPPTPLAAVAVAAERAETGSKAPPHFGVFFLYFFFGGVFFFDRVNGIGIRMSVRIFFFFLVSAPD